MSDSPDPPDSPPEPPDPPPGAAADGLDPAAASAAEQDPGAAGDYATALKDLAADPKPRL